MKTIFLIGVAVLLSVSAHSSDLVLAEDGRCDYQIVIPNQAADEVVDQWLLATAKLMQAAFAKNGYEIDVVKEEEKSADKPGIYLGSTTLARKNGILTDLHEDWSYHQKVIGRDLMIAGNDHLDPHRTLRSSKMPLALLGTVKGVCDFLREHAGVRFLFLNMESGPMRSESDGSLNLDTRSIAFLPMNRIAVPEHLDLKKTPMMRACDNSGHETFYLIANNFFPLLSSIQGETLAWNEVITPEKYAKTHPEYFALLPNGKRSFERGFEVNTNEIQTGQIPLCPTHPGVQDLMFEAAEALIQKGNATILISPPDSYRLCQCNCERCIQLFGIEAKGWNEGIYARGKSGKLWQAYFSITERLRQKYPKARVVIWDYQDTPIETVAEYPENVIPQLQFGKREDFDRLQGLRIPAGICALEETFTGFGICGPYAPERTPEHIAEMARLMASNRVQWSRKDGSMGYVRGLQAPAYYVYGRMMDDPSADWREIQQEFCESAFGNAASVMGHFFDQLHEQIGLYSDFFGVNMIAASRKYARTRLRDNKWHITNIYTPEYCELAEKLLSSAETLTANDTDRKVRLHLIRIEFDYLRDLSRIFHFENAWLLDQSPERLIPVLDALDQWHGRLEALAGGTGRSSFKTLDDWPEMRPFAGHFYSHAALEHDMYQQRWDRTCLGWDSAAIRDWIPKRPSQIQVTKVDETPKIDSPAWELVPAMVLGEHDRYGMPLSKLRTTLRVLRDSDGLSVRLDCLYPTQNPEDMLEPKTESDVLRQEYVEISFRPSSDGPLYRFAANPTDGKRYDSLWKLDAKNRLVEEASWNAGWQFSVQTSGEKVKAEPENRVWTACFRIPFGELGSEAPKQGETWEFNAARKWIRDSGHRYLIWCDASSVTDVKSMGKLGF